MSGAIPPVINAAVGSIAGEPVESPRMIGLAFDALKVSGTNG
jgi:hypothetical protein